MVTHLCEVAGVSKSGYYYFLSNKSEVHRTKKESQDLEDIEIIKAAMNYKGFKKGSRMICMQLKEKGIIFNRKKVQRLMRKFGVVCPVRKAKPYRRVALALKESSHAKNKIKRNFKPGKINTTLLTDITYIYYGKARNKAYLSVIKDSQTNEILSYVLSKSLQMPLVMETVNKLMNNETFKVNDETTLHSDQGAHYTSQLYRELLEHYGITRSMSRRGNCWDNAPIESFFGHLKQETTFSDKQTFDQLESYIDEYMYYYNNERPQMSLKKTTPVNYRNCPICV